MRKILLAGLLSLIMGGVYIAASPAAGPSGDIFQKARAWLYENKLSSTHTRDDAFAKGYVLTLGTGSPRAGERSRAMKEKMAFTAAEAEANREIAKVLNGVIIISDPDDPSYVKTFVQGIVRGGTVVYREYNTEQDRAVVLIRKNLVGPDSVAEKAYEAIMEDAALKKKAATKKFYNPAAPTPPEGLYDGLIVDTGGHKFSPAIINRIFVAGGEVLYDPSAVDRAVFVERGSGVYAGDLSAAKAALGERGVQNPLVVKAYGAASISDLAVSEEDAGRIFSGNITGKFLESARVAFVIK